MKEIIWIGRGGQGAFTAAKLFGAAYTENGEDSYSLSFPSFGPERRGAPVKAFTKLDSKQVSDRSQTEKADYIVILDETLYNDSIKHLLKENGTIIINSSSDYEDAISFDGSSLAKELRLPVVNTVMAGYLTKYCELVSIDNLKLAIDDYMPERIREKNKNAIQEAVK